MNVPDEGPRAASDREQEGSMAVWIVMGLILVLAYVAVLMLAAPGR